MGHDRRRETSATVDSGDLALGLHLHEARKLADPLAFRLFSSEEQRDATKALCEGLETYIRTPNIGGKTEWGSMIVVALMQGRKQIDGRTIREAEAGVPQWFIDLPTVPTPCTGYFITPGYAQSLEAGIAALKKQLGEWPHKIVYTKGESAGYVSAILVKPIGCASDDPADWSRLTVFVDKGIAPEGGRIDFAWADEPPSESVWREVRMRRKANAPMFRLITATPLDRARWEWLRADYEKSLAGKREIVMHHISRNQALSPEHIRQQEADAEGDPLKRARLFGEYVDTTGLCPFDYHGLEVMARFAEPGKRWELDTRVEVWRVPNPVESYWLLMDPSSGKLPGIRWVGSTSQEVKRDKCGLWVVARRSRALVARVFDHITPDEMTLLAMDLGHWYNDALIVPECNGVGEVVVPMLLKAGYPNIYREFAVDRADFRQTETLGWYSSAERRASGIAALARQVKQAALGQPYLDIPSSEAVDSLKGIHMDERGRPFRRPGQNWEDMILGSMTAFLMEHPAHAMPPEKKPEDMTGAEAFESALSESMGRRVRIRPPREQIVERWR